MPESAKKAQKRRKKGREPGTMHTAVLRLRAHEGCKNSVKKRIKTHKNAQKTI